MKFFFRGGGDFSTHQQSVLLSVDQPKKQAKKNHISVLQLFFFSRNTHFVRSQKGIGKFLKDS